jgi:uncharacterized membrane protein YdjX (TVP38/TMEM64 family)
MGIAIGIVIALGATCCGCVVSLLITALYRRLFGKEEIQEKFSDKRDDILQRLQRNAFVAQKQELLSAFRKNQVAKTALSSILFMAQEHVPTHFTKKIAELASEALDNIMNEGQNESDRSEG